MPTIGGHDGLAAQVRAHLRLDARTLVIQHADAGAVAMLGEDLVGRFPWERIDGLDRGVLAAVAAQRTALTHEALHGRAVLEIHASAGDDHVLVELEDVTARFPVVDSEAPQPLLLLSPAGRVARVGGGAARLLRVDATEAIGRLVGALVGGSAAVALTEAVLTAAAGTTATVEATIGHGATRRDVAIDLTGLRQGERVLGLLGVVRDVSAQKIAERALETSEARYRKLTELSSEGIYRLRLLPLPTFEYVNPAMAELTGFRTDELYADPEIPLRAVHPDDREAVRAARAGEVAIQRTYRIHWQRPDGALVCLEVNEVPILDGGGEVVALQGIVSDVTRREHEQEALARALEQERAASDELRNVHAMQAGFLQSVSHEVRTPLTNVVGYASTLENFNDRLDDDQRGVMLRRLVHNAHRLRRLLADLLDVERALNGMSIAERVPVNIGDLIRNVVEEVGSIERISVEVDELVARLDGPKVERIIDNLVHNALKHTPEDSPVTVRASAEDDGVTLVVEDRGPGVPDRIKAAVFEPFRQELSGTAAAKPGTGIGLTLVQQFALLHGGGAWIEDREGGGARFCVHLPATVVHQAGAAAS